MRKLQREQIRAMHGNIITLVDRVGDSTSKQSLHQVLGTLPELVNQLGVVVGRLAQKTSDPLPVTAIEVAAFEENKRRTDLVLTLPERIAEVLNRLEAVEVRVQRMLDAARALPGRTGMRFCMCEDGGEPGHKCPHRPDQVLRAPAKQPRIPRPISSGKKRKR